jgi:shikimate kinase
MNTRIILVGFMGCGKTTLGKKLANRLNFKFIDSDILIEQKNAKSVQEIFEKMGETYFREQETKIIDELSNENYYVLSTGGGMPCFNDNMSKLRNIGTIFYLKLSPFELAKRLNEAKKVRPLILNKSEDEIYEFVKEKLNQRKIFYEKADYVLKGKDQNVKKIIELIKGLV